MNPTADRKTFTVLGATSDTGRLVADSRAAAGCDVRRVSRQHGVSLDDAAALNAAFAGADGAHLMMPFDLQAPEPWGSPPRTTHNAKLIALAHRARQAFGEGQAR